MNVVYIRLKLIYNVITIPRMIINRLFCSIYCWNIGNSKMH